MTSKKKIESLLPQFCSITGADEAVGRQLLEACGGNLELAVDMHMDGAATSQPSTSGAQGTSNSEDVRAPIPQTREVLVDEEPQFGFRGRKRKTRSVFDGFRDFQAEAEQQEEMQQGTSNVRTRKTRTLQDLFRPPIDLTYKGTFANAKDAGKSQGKWLMINIQNVQEFSCQTLNRDVWSNSAVKTIIKEHFIFWQVYHDSEEGKKYRQFYKVSDWPYVAVLDPRTGENMVIWTKVEPLTFCDLVTEFLSQNPNVDSLSPPAKREDSIVDATEDDQLQAAIKASLTEVTVAAKSDLSVSDSGSDSELETFSDSEEDTKPSPVKTRRTSGSETLRHTRGSSKQNSPLRTERPCSSRSEKRDSPLRKDSQSPSSSKSVKEGSPVLRNKKPSSPAVRKSARNSPLRLDSSDSGENSNLTPKKVCSPKRTGSPLNKNSPLKKGSPSVKSSPQRNSPQRKPQKCESIHNDVHPAVIDNIRKSIDSDNQESNDVNESVSSASEVSDLSKQDESLETVTDTRDYTKYLGNEADEKATLMLRFPDGEREKLSIPVSSKLMAVILFVGSKGYSNERYELIAHYPRRELSHLDFDATLKAVGLHSQETIFIQSRL